MANALSYQKIHSSLALAPGSEIWFFMSGQQSNIFYRVDWLCNYIFRKWNFRKTSKISPELISILGEEKIELDQIVIKKDAPLLADTSLFLPNKYTIIYPKDRVVDHLAAMEALEIISNLGKKTVRVFLDGTSEESIILKSIKEFPGQKNKSLSDLTFEIVYHKADHVTN